MRLNSLYLLTIFGACIFLLTLCPSAKSEEEKGKPCITIDKLSYDFGKVEEGIKLKHTFKISNTGDALLHINDAHASCGCTIPTLAKKYLQPGEATSLNVILDTSMKQKAITKFVFVSSNDSDNPMVKIQLSMFVKDPHENMKGDLGVKIFKEPHCASCHVDKGRNLIASRLYEADCAMCHGTFGKGAFGPSLVGPYDNKEFSAAIKKVTSYGSKTSHSMPGFLDKAGGPLSAYQIDTIMEYLALVSKTPNLIPNQAPNANGGLTKSPSAAK